jgi:Protein of unknown function DUF58
VKRLLGILRRSGAWLWRLRHLLPVAPLGLCLFGVGYWISFSVGAREVDYVLRAAGLIAMGAVTLTTLVVLMATIRVWLGVRRLPPGEDDLLLETGLTGSTGARLPCLNAWPLLTLRVSWEEPEEVSVTLVRRAGRCDELVTPALRGEANRVVRRFVVEDILGFARWGVVQVRREQKLRFTPPRAQVTANAITRFLGGDALSHPTGPVSGELLEMRRYAYGDPLRHVLWKAFARTRKLLVRTPERAITPRPSAVAYMVAGPGDEPAAGAARYFVEEGLLGADFLFGADGAATPTDDPNEALDQIVLSSRARRRGGEGLAPFLGRLTSKQLEACILFVPPEPGPWLPLVEAVAHRISGTRVITALDAPLEPRPESRLRSLLFRPRRHAAAAARARLSGALSRLAALGFDIHVLHRPTGEFMARSQVDALFDAPAPARSARP